jgi:hypothetical protein
MDFSTDFGRINLDELEHSRALASQGQCFIPTSPYQHSYKNTQLNKYSQIERSNQNPVFYQRPNSHIQNPHQNPIGQNSNPSHYPGSFYTQTTNNFPHQSCNPGVNQFIQGEQSQSRLIFPNQSIDPGFHHNHPNNSEIPQNLGYVQEQGVQFHPQEQSFQPAVHLRSENLFHHTGQNFTSDLQDEMPNDGNNGVQVGVQVFSTTSLLDENVQALSSMSML